MAWAQWSGRVSHVFRWTARTLFNEYESLGQVLLMKFFGFVAEKTFERGENGIAKA